jgi:hypothetical protein
MDFYFWEEVNAIILNVTYLNGYLMVKMLILIIRVICQEYRGILIPLSQINTLRLISIECLLHNVFLADA